MNLAKIILLASIAICTSLPAAEVFTWTDEQGVKHFSSNKPRNTPSNKLYVESDPQSARKNIREQKKQAKRNRTWAQSALNNQPNSRNYKSTNKNQPNCNVIIKNTKKSIDKKMKYLLHQHKYYKITQKKYRTQIHQLTNLKRSLSYNQCLTDLTSYKNSIYRCMNQYNNPKRCIN
ncbi:DUF4124 domain-containing protein [Pelagibaculum spongiae]|uniref:DUF4124 domain-containing protein n=1 Tax=Pelagibaculum spongiae TaxID=2080658 RepID=A0A2V1GV89_9GAMM|nr:DUF4124 domain-containing protein [Pelagibaculum spongiae]PVZ63412.1 hypothetical protein DC094_21115 [Pelagibaculum spongiae]